MWSLLLIMTALKAEETCPMESYLRDSIAVNLYDYYLATSELVAICRVKTKKGTGFGNMTTLFSLSRIFMLNP